MWIILCIQETLKAYLFLSKFYQYYVPDTTVIQKILQSLVAQSIHQNTLMASVGQGFGWSALGIADHCCCMVAIMI